MASQLLFVLVFVITLMGIVFDFAQVIGFPRFVVPYLCLINFHRSSGSYLWHNQQSGTVAYQFVSHGAAVRENRPWVIFLANHYRDL